MARNVYQLEGQQLRLLRSEIDQAQRYLLTSPYHAGEALKRADALLADILADGQTVEADD